ncbi:MAG: class I SAM-dependent methyltransferase [Candidatus Omnitrophota bacterium]
MSKGFSFNTVIKKILPENVIDILREIRIRVLRMLGKDIDYFYDEEFAKVKEYRDKEWTGDFCNIILKLFGPSSVIDFGCGTGDILAPFESKGIQVKGVDGSKANRKYSKIKPENFILYDLRKGYDPGERYDLCFCLEVAEHIAEKYSDTLIETLTTSSETVIFTAASPGQEGKNHVNLKPYEWWQEKFEDRGFLLDTNMTDQLKAEMRNISGIQWWYLNNMKVFKKR